MKRKWVIGAAAAMIALLGGAVVLMPNEAMADCAGVETSIIDCDDSAEGEQAVYGILKTILGFLSASVGALGVLGVVIAGIMYMTARDNEAQVAKAKTRLIEIAIGLVAFAVLGAVVTWLIPGGVPDEIGGVNTTVGGGGSGSGSGGGTGGSGSGNGGTGGGE